MIGTLPRSLEVNGKFYRIRSDFRDVLKIVIAFGDPDLEDKEKAYICLFILFKDFDAIPKDDYEAAFKAALAFIDHNDKPEDTAESRLRASWTGNRTRASCFQRSIRLPVLRSVPPGMFTGGPLWATTWRFRTAFLHRCSTCV